MALMNDMVAKLTRRAQIVPQTEDSKLFSVDTLQQLIVDALNEHNSSLTLDVLTPAEEVPVLLLAQIECCYIRANNHAGDQPIKATAAVAQPAYLSKTPFDNWISLAGKLMLRYTALCASMGMSSGVSDVVAVNTVFKKSDRLDTYLTSAITPLVPPAQLSVTPAAGGEADVTWAQIELEIFQGNFLFWSITPGVYRVTNPKGCMTVPYISPSARLATKTFDVTERGVVLTGLPTGMTVYLLLATRSINRKWTYSNEVAVAMP